MQGVIYTGGDAPPFACVAPCLAPKRLVVAADSGYDRAQAHGVQVDVLVGDLDSVSTPHIMPASVRRIQVPREKDATDTELAIDYCRDAGCRELLLVGGGGGDADHLFALLWLFEGRRRVKRWLLPNATIDCVEPTEVAPDIAAADAPAGAAPADAAEPVADAPTAGRWSLTGCAPSEIVSLLPVGAGPWRAKSTGLRWPLDGVRWRRDLVAIRNEARADTVSITVARGRLLVVHSLG